MNKNAMGEPLSIIMSIILMAVVFGIGFLLFGAEKVKETITFQGPSVVRITGADTYSDWFFIESNQDILFSILNFETEYGDFATLIASKDEEKIKAEIEKIQKDLKENADRDLILGVIYPGDKEELLEQLRNKFETLLGVVPIPDSNGEMVFLFYGKNE